MASGKRQAAARGPADGLKVKMLPKDPLVAKTDALGPVDVTIAAPTAGDGPSSARVCVVDYNADLDTLFEPARLLKDGTGFKGIKGLAVSGKWLDSFTFHQVNVWAVIEQTLTWLEDEQALARPIPWASGLGRLLVLPHAGYSENAFYDRSTGALHFFYFEGPSGDPVYTCLSRDIITHELGHAVLDGLKPLYNEVSSPETAGFHEYFGDAIAMMASVRTREIALKLTDGIPTKLAPKNIVSAIASEFGAALHGLEDHDYLRGAWNVRTMSQLEGKFEEHDWSEILTGVYFELLQFLYTTNLNDITKEMSLNAKAAVKPAAVTQQHCMRAVMRAAGQTANVMLRALDYCPPVDLRYDEYARALLRADEIAYPIDTLGVRKELQKSFKRRKIKPAPEDYEFNAQVSRALREMSDIDAITATPADAYRFVDAHRRLFGLPHEANLRICSVYSTRKNAASGFRQPRERIIEFTWTEDVELIGPRFGELRGTYVDLFCGGTLVFDSNGNFLHYSLVKSSPQRRKDLLAYMTYHIGEGNIGISDGVQGLGAPKAAGYRIAGSITDGRLKLSRTAALRHSSAKHHRH